MPGVLLFSAVDAVNAEQSPGPGGAAASLSVPSLFSHCALGTAPALAVYFTLLCKHNMR